MDWVDDSLYKRYKSRVCMYLDKLFIVIHDLVNSIEVIITLLVCMWDELIFDIGIGFQGDCSSVHMLYMDKCLMRYVLKDIN